MAISPLKTRFWSDLQDLQGTPGSFERSNLVFARRQFTVKWFLDYWLREGSNRSQSDSAGFNRAIRTFGAEGPIRCSTMIFLLLGVAARRHRAVE